MGLGLALLCTVAAQACDDGSKSAEEEAPAAAAQARKNDAKADAKSDDAAAKSEGAPVLAGDSPDEEVAAASTNAKRNANAVHLGSNANPLGGAAGAAPPAATPTPQGIAVPDARHEEDAGEKTGGKDEGSRAQGRTAEESTAMLFSHYGVGPTIATAENDTSTFGIDVDTASYSVLRAHLDRGELPDTAAVRVEEVVNYFDYHYAPPESGDFSLHAEVVPSPQRTGYHVLHLGIKGKEVKAEDRMAANLVFVIDVSGSMRGDRLSTVKKSLAMLVDQLRADDSVGIVAYGSKARVVLSPTSGSERQQILAAIDGLRTEGSTNVQAGLELGYELVAKAKVGAGINRVVLCSDGVANTGATTAEAILKNVAEHAARGITISSIGVGMGGYNDTLMEKLADKGNGNYAYVDDLDEAKRVFVEHLTGTLQVIAKDVKIQVQFDDKVVTRYRLLGYENRGLTKRDFDDDTKDAGDIGAGHTVTALYEVKIADDEADGLGTLRVRYKKPRGTQSELIERPLPTSLVRRSYDEAAPPTRLSMVAAAYAEKLRDSYWVRNLSWQQVQGMYDQIDASLKTDPAVAELGRLIGVAAKLDSRPDRFESAAPLARMDFDKVPVLR
ncbi:MAG: von Willebrand factor type A domain-containing protein [Myxococcota bacterium]